MKSVIYARVSSREQEETGYSLDAQEKLLREYAEKKDYTVSRTFRVTESASKSQTRKTLGEMLAYAEKSGIAVILCEKIDRLTRNLKDAATVDDWIRTKEGREVHFVKENFVLNENTRAHENLVWDMKVAIARFYTNNLSEEVKKGQKEKISQGWLPTKPPLGYKSVGDKGHKVHILDEEKAPFVREMFELYATGNYSIKALVKEMHKRGLRNRVGGKIGKSRMHDLLTDPFYRGDLRWKGQITKGSQPPLVSRKLFESVQFLLGRKLTSPQYRKHLPVFKAKLNCGECGGTITWEIQKGNWYGHCNHHKKCSKTGTTRQDRLEQMLFPYFDGVAPKSERVLRWLERALKESHAEEIEQNAHKRDEIARGIARADQRMERAYIDKLDGQMESALCQKVIEEAKQEKVALLEALEGLGEAQVAYYEAGYAIHELATHAKEIYESQKATVEEKRLLLSYVFSNIELEQATVRPNYTYAFEFLSEWVPKLNESFELEKSQSMQAQISPLQAEMSSLLRG